MNLSKLRGVLSHPLATLDYQLEKKALRGLSDKTFMRLRYFFRLKKPIHLSHPRTFNEKLQYLKLYNRQPELHRMVDKLEAKEIIRQRIGEDYLIPTLGSWDRPEDVDYDSLPDRFVLKTTHDSGGVAVCRDKASFDRQKAGAMLREHLGRDYYYHAREWPYKGLPRRIMAEEFVENPGEDCLVVYKVFNFGGVPGLIQVIQGDKSSRETIDYFDPDWKLLDLRQNFPNSPVHLPRPRCLEEMLRLSGELSEGMPFLRTDWYIVGGKLKFSEFTLYSDAGFAVFTPDHWDRDLGERIDLTLLKA